MGLTSTLSGSNGHLYTVLDTRGPSPQYPQEAERPSVQNGFTHQLILLCLPIFLRCLPPTPTPLRSLAHRVVVLCSAAIFPLQFSQSTGTPFFLPFLEIRHQHALGDVHLHCLSRYELDIASPLSLFPYQSFNSQHAAYKATSRGCFSLSFFHYPERD